MKTKASISSVSFWSFVLLFWRISTFCLVLEVCHVVLVLYRINLGLKEVDRKRDLNEDEKEEELEWRRESRSMRLKAQGASRPRAWDRRRPLSASCYEYSTLAVTTSALVLSHGWSVKERWEIPFQGFSLKKKMECRARDDQRDLANDLLACCRAKS